MSSVLAGVGEVVGGWLPALLLGLFATLLLLRFFGRRPKNFPPGMMILPMVGSLLSMPFGPNMEMMRGLKKKYGDMASFAIFGTRVVVVSGVSLMKEVFGKRNTTARPDMAYFMFRCRVSTDGRSPYVGVINTSGQLWQEQRRFVLHHLRDFGFGKSSCEPVMREEIAEMLDSLAKEEGRPIVIKPFFNRSVVNILWPMVIGRRFPYGHAKLNKILKTLNQVADINFISPVHHIPHVARVFDYIPSLKKLTGGVKDVCQFLKEEINEFLDNEELRNGDNFTSLYLKEIEKNENPNFNVDQLAGLLFDIFFAGMETSSSTLTTAIYLLTKHTHVQRRVQQELDEVVGRDRLPSLSDMDQLPYVQAAIREVQRVFNLAKFALPHVTTEDCKLGGYDIPKGTWLLPNIDDAHRSSENWKNPGEFDPQNFLDANGKYKNNSASMPFGVGKRLCAGEPLARLEIFLFFTHLFQRFSFTLGEERKPISEANPVMNAPPEFTTSVKCRSK